MCISSVPHSSESAVVEDYASNWVFRGILLSEDNSKSFPSTFNCIGVKELHHDNIYRCSLHPRVTTQPKHTDGHCHEFHRYTVQIYGTLQPKLPNSRGIFRKRTKVGPISSGFSGNCSGGAQRPSWCLGETPFFRRWGRHCGRGWYSHLHL